MCGALRLTVALHERSIAAMLQQFRSLLQHGKRSFGSLGAVRLFLLLAQQISQLPAGSKPAVTICFSAGTQAASCCRSLS